MKVETIQMVSRQQARELWRKYQEHRNYQEPYDEEIAQIYRRIAQGHTVVRALEAIRKAGRNEQGFPKLAIARADATEIHWQPSHVYGVFNLDSWARSNQSSRRRVRIDWPECRSDWPNGRAIVPIVPVHLRPKRGLANYHILFEAEWQRTYPRDPYLLRRFGGDAWLVVAAWELTEVERAVMSQRMHS
jgi:hypothetical protein